MVQSIVKALLFKPPDPEPYDFPAKTVALVTSRGETIAAVFVKRRGAHVTLLFSHGNAEDLDSSYSWMRRLSKELNVNVLGYDYSGYGESTGTPSEENCYADIDACYAYLRDERGILPHQIVLYGRSLGSGPSCYLAQRTATEGMSVAGLMLHSPFTSVYRVVLDLGFTIAGDQFSNVDRIRDVQCPVFIAHGKLDNVVPFVHGLSLYAAVPEQYKTAPFWADDMGHNDHSEELRELLMRRFNEYLDYNVLARRLYLLPPPSSARRKKRSQSNQKRSPSASPTSVRIDNDQHTL